MGILIREQVWKQAGSSLRVYGMFQKHRRQMALWDGEWNELYLVCHNFDHILQVVKRIVWEVSSRKPKNKFVKSN